MARGRAAVAYDAENEKNADCCWERQWGRGATALLLVGCSTTRMGGLALARSFGAPRGSLGLGIFDVEGTWSWPGDTVRDDVLCT